MRAAILAGGRGSRLQPFTTVIPKPLVPVGEYPIVEILIRQLAAQGFDRLTMSVGYLAPLIEAYCGSGERWGVRVDYLREDEPLGTAGFLGLLTDLEEDRLLVVNGDILTDLDIAAVYLNHDPTDAATICTNMRSVAIEFGVVTKEGGYLAAYTEKPVLSYEVSMGINVISRWAIDEYVEQGVRLDMPDLIQRARLGGHRVRVASSSSSFWLDMGRLADLDLANEVLQREPERFLSP